MPYETILYSEENHIGLLTLEQALHLENRNQAFLIAAMKMNA